MARPVVGIIGNHHLINDQYPSHAGGTMNSQAVAEVAGAMPLLVPADPRFVSAEDRDYRLDAGSPAVDIGLTAFLPADAFDLDRDGDVDELLPVDLAGGERVQGSAVDLGPYESGFTVPSEAEAWDVTDRLAPPYPNPSSGRVVVPITLAVPRGHVIVDVLDVLGRRVDVLHSGPLAAGEHLVDLNGKVLPAGTYVVRVAASERSYTRRFTVVR